MTLRTIADDDGCTPALDCRAMSGTLRLASRFEDIRKLVLGGDRLSDVLVSLSKDKPLNTAKQSPIDDQHGHWDSRVMVAALVQVDMDTHGAPSDLRGLSATSVAYLHHSLQPSDWAFVFLENKAKGVRQLVHGGSVISARVASTRAPRVAVAEGVCGSQCLYCC